MNKGASPRAGKSSRGKEKKMYQIIVNSGWASESIYDEYSTIDKARKAMNKLINDGIYEPLNLSIVVKWQGGNEISGDNYGL
jgi:hypothetical protein